MKNRQKISKKSVSVELSFYGDGRIVENPPGVYSGGVVEPQLDKNLDFNMYREVPDENGILNPVADEDTVESAFQINIWGNSQGFRELARYLLAIAEIDTGTDPNFHEHHEFISGDRRTHFHIIVRKTKEINAEIIA